MGFRGRGALAVVPIGAPTQSVDIGDPFITGGTGVAADAGHGHAFPAGTGSSGTLGSASVGSSTFPARFDHRHAHTTAQHSAGGQADLSPFFATLPSAATGLQYVAVGGNDSQDGLSLGTPKASVAAALAALPASGGVVMVGPGTYATAAAITIGTSNVAVMAILPRSVTIQATADVGSPVPAGWLGLLRVRDPLGSAGVAVDRVTLDGIIIDANGQTNTPAATIQGVTRFYARRCVFRGAGTNAVGGVLVLGGNTSGPSGVATDQVFFDGCEFSNSASHGCALGGSSGAASAQLTNVVFSECSVHDNANDGINNFVAIQFGIRSVLIDACVFTNNGTSATSGTNRGHVNDGARNGWMDLEVRGCWFGQSGAAVSGGFSDHKGWNIHVHHNTFRLNNAGIWPIALGETNTLAANLRSRFVWITDNYFEGNNTIDFDSSTDIFIQRNVFYRVNGRPLGMFGNHLRNEITDNFFVECGQGSPVNDYEKAGISLGTGGVAIRRNTFVDNQGTPTMLHAVVENTGGNLTGPITYEDNDMSGVGTPMVKAATYDSVRFVRRNKGVNPGTPIVQGVGASPWTYTNGDTPVVFRIRNSGGGVNITKGGVQIVANAADGTGTNTADILLEPHEAIILTYPGTAPTCYLDVR